jgi:hypothetical protein
MIHALSELLRTSKHALQNPVLFRARSARKSFVDLRSNYFSFVA